MSWITALTKNRKSLIGKTAALVLGISISLQLVPGVHAANYVAKDGDTFYTLAQRFNVSVDTLMKANPSVQPNNIYKGLNITIPDSFSKGVIGQAAAAAAQDNSDDPQDSPTLKVLGDNKVQAWGKTYSYSKLLSMTATAYTAEAGQNGKWGAVDYFGNPLQLGTIAVDPKVIPMGTKVLVTGHNYAGLPKGAFIAVASDQGGNIKGNRVDIFVPGATNISQFGFQDVKLYVIK